MPYPETEHHSPLEKGQDAWVELLNLNLALQQFLKDELKVVQTTSGSLGNLSLLTHINQQNNGRPLKYNYQLLVAEKASDEDLAYLALHAAAHLIQGDMLRNESISEASQPYQRQSSQFKDHVRALMLTETSLQKEKDKNTYDTLATATNQYWATAALGYTYQLREIVQAPEFNKTRTSLMERVQKEKKLLGSS